jgi:hypothetical protein
LHELLGQYSLRLRDTKVGTSWSLVVLAVVAVVAVVVSVVIVVFGWRQASWLGLRRS